jgi:predicted aconitase
LSTADDADIITLGSPQLGINELKLLAKLTETKNLQDAASSFVHGQFIITR